MIIKTREEIYKILYRKMKREFLKYELYHSIYNPMLGLLDNASRMATQFAVKNTESMYQKQLEMIKVRGRLIDYIKNGFNIHQISELLNLEAEQIIELLNQ